MNPKHLMYLVALSLLCGCGRQPKPQSETEKVIAESQRFIDSFKIAKQADSMTKDIIRNALFDTAGVSVAPVKVLSAKLIEREYSNYKDIRVSWKNVGSKRIAAIRFMWYGLNAFGEAADMGGHIQKGFGGGMADRSLSVGKTDSGTWEIMSKDGKKVVTAWPYEIAFEDGTKWKSGK
jgi:hypothetical protein